MASTHPDQKPDYDKRLRWVLSRVPYEWLDDAEQEAALAKLEGRDPVQAVVNFYKREDRYRNGRPAERDRSRTPAMRLMGDRDGEVVSHRKW